MTQPSALTTMNDPMLHSTRSSKKRIETITGCVNEAAIPNAFANTFFNQAASNCGKIGRGIAEIPLTRLDLSPDLAVRVLAGDERDEGSSRLDRRDPGGLHPLDTAVAGLARAAESDDDGA